jgi:hypothetical protein
LFIVFALNSIGQGNTLYEVNVVKPKAGLRSAFEASWKLHLARYHKTTDKRNVYEVTSGPANGSYVIVEGPFTYADMDKTKPNTKEHGLDLERNFSPKLETGSQNFIASQADSLSHNANVRAEKILVTITMVKEEKMEEYLAEARRTTIIHDKFSSPFSFATLVKQQAGSNTTIITLRLLKEGYKELEAGYYSYPPNILRDTYVQEYGKEAWDKRLKLMAEAEVSREQHFEVFRADLSSK